MRSEDLFAGSAGWYARYRAPYPEEAFAIIRDAFDLDGTGTLLDLGCGTGQVCVPMAADFARVVALDVDSEMLEEGRCAARAAGVDGIEWVRGRAEEAVPRLGPVRLATCGNAFHWMDRDRVLADLDEIVEPDGGVAFLAGGSIGLWSTDAPWAIAVLDVIRRRLGDRRRAGRGTFDPSPDRHEDVCRRSAFSRVEITKIPVVRRWSVDEFIGALFSTSYCSPTVLGDGREAVEADLRAALVEALGAGESIVHPVTLDVILARRPKLRASPRTR